VREKKWSQKRYCVHFVPQATRIENPSCMSSSHNTRSNNIDKSKSIKSNTNTDRDDVEGRHESLEGRGRVVLVGEEKIVVY